MSGGNACKCEESKKPVGERNWVVMQRNCNHSAFSGYHYTPSDSGDVTGLSGNVTGLSGDVSGLSGDVTGLSGDVDDCDISADDRKNGIQISTLIGD